MSCSLCGSSGTLRPNVVWFGEAIPLLDTAQRAIQECNLFMAIGTSGTVYPAAAFVEDAKAVSAHTVELNLERSSVSSRFDEVVLGPATLVVPEFVDELLTRQNVRRNR